MTATLVLAVLFLMGVNGLATGLVAGVCAALASMGLGVWVAYAIFKAGFALMRGGYRALLRPPPRKE